MWCISRCGYVGWGVLVVLFGAGCIRSDQSATPAIETEEQERLAAPLIGKTAGEEHADNGLGMKFCWCPPGNFTMGRPQRVQFSDGTLHWQGQVEVTLTRGFWLGKYEVTQEEYQRVMGENPSWFQGDRASAKQGNQLPVERVSWFDATKFCKKLTAMERAAGRLAENEVYCLPTEAEWEYACRAGSTGAYCFGDDVDQLPEYAWFSQEDHTEMKNHPVGLKKPNAWGLHDVHGNVAEWCQDWYTSQLPGGRDPVVLQKKRATQVRQSLAGRVLRGGRYYSPAWACGASIRDGRAPGELGRGANSGSWLGFRVARGPSGQASLE